MWSQLPTMIALRCFEATARHLSVTQAAEELSLTQSAVSRQIKKLEGMLGCPLFRRVKQRLQLTDSGHEYASDVGPLLDQLAAATRQVRRGVAGHLRVGVELSFTTRWLLPRMEDFTARHPELDVEIMNDLRQLYERREGFDVGILYGDGTWPDFETHFLMQGELVAVCTPALRERYGLIVEPRDLLHYPLLHHVANAAPAGLSSTYLWLQAAGLSETEITALPGQRFEHFQFVLDAALHGIGATVLPAYFVTQELASGRLVEASQTPLICGAYYVALRRTRAGDPGARAFADWLLQMVEAPASGQ